MIAKGTMQTGMPLHHSQFHPVNFPSPPLTPRRRAIAHKNVIQSLRARIRCAILHHNFLPPIQPLLHLVAPPPRIQRAVARRPVLPYIEPCRRHRAAPGPLQRIACSAERRVRVKNPPRVVHAPVPSQDPVRERVWREVEVAECDDEMPASNSAVEQFSHFPRLSRTVAEIGVLRLWLVRGVQVGVEDLDDSTGVAV